MRGARNFEKVYIGVTLICISSSMWSADRLQNEILRCQILIHITVGWIGPRLRSNAQPLLSAIIRHSIRHRHQAHAEDRDQSGGSTKNRVPGGSSSSGCSAFAASSSPSVLTRAPLGGGANIAPLPDFLDNSKTAAYIDTKLSVPSSASI